SGSFGMSGRVLVIDHQEAERISQAMNARRDLSEARQRVQPGTLAAAALLHELMHAVMVTYQMGDHAVGGMEEAVGAGAVDAVMQSFHARFPVPDVETSPDNVPAPVGDTVSLDSYQQRVATAEEMVLHTLALQNRALEPLRELFEPGELAADAQYVRARDASLAALARVPVPADGVMPKGGADAEGSGGERGPASLLELLTAPQRRHPDSLFDQLQAALGMWAVVLRDRYRWLLERALRGLDQLLEER